MHPLPLQESDTPRTPDWWLLYLGRKLNDRRKRLALYRDYYRGEHPLPQGVHTMDQQHLNAWREFQKKARTNFCALPVIATVNRQLAIGVTDENGNEDKAAWKWWQDNKMDSRQKQLYRMIGSAGVAYLMVGPHPKDARRPLITVEHPTEVITEHDPATGEVIAALKAWHDPIDKLCRATLYLPDAIARYVTTSWPGTRGIPWGRENWEPIADPVPNALQRPPVVQFEREPDLGEDPVPDFWAIRDLQDRLNLSVLNRMTIERYAAHPQKYATGTKVQKTIDPLTGLEIPVNPYRPGPDSVWINESESGSFGYIPAADMLQLLKTHQFDIATMFVLTSTPAYYMPTGDMINVSTDTVLALETNHVAKCNEQNTQNGEGIEEAFALAAKIAGDDRDFSSHEVRWKDPRQLNPAVIADMGVKKKSIGWPLTMIAEDMGESPQRVERIRTEAAAQAALAAATGQQQQQQQAAQVGAPGQVSSGPLTVTIPDNLQGLV